MAEGKKDMFGGERPHLLCMAVSYIEVDDQHRCTPGVYLSSNEVIWYRDGEDIWGKLESRFKSIERMIQENKKHGQLCFLARNHFFYSQRNKLTADERVDLLKGCRFTRDQIADIRRIISLCEQVLDEEDKANDNRGDAQ